MTGPPPIRIVLWNDGGEALAEGVESEEQQDVLRSFATLVSDSIDAVLELPQFRHVEAVQVEDAAEGSASTLSIGFDTATGDGEVALESIKGAVDVAGLLLGSAALPAELSDVAELVTDEEQGVTELQLSDPSLTKQVNAIVKRARLQKRYNDWMQSVEPALVDALDAASANVEQTETPLDPFDVIQAIVAQLVRVADVSPPAPSLLSRGRQLVGRVLGAPGAAVGLVSRRLRRAQRLLWRLEDVVVDGGKLAIKVALKAARPVLVGVVLHRALQTLDRSRSLEARMARLPPDQAMEEYYRTLLGSDWRQQLQEDWDQAVKDVEDGLITEEINQEKRLITARHLRNLEVEEWDKQRMKNFYLASFGGLQWFAKMEEALHNPLFIESRGWTDPPETWIGKNRTYLADLPADEYMSNVGSVALRLKQAELGRDLTAAEAAKVLGRGAALSNVLPVETGGLAAAALAAGGALVPRAAKK